MHHLPELLASDALLVLAFLVDEMRLLHDITRAEKQHAFAWQSIAPGAARLLIIPSDILRQILMYSEQHVMFIVTASARTLCSALTDPHQHRRLSRYHS